jgi:hypothetical protein
VAHLVQAAIACLLSVFLAHDKKRPVGPFAKLRNTREPEAYNSHLIGNFDWEVLSASALLVPRNRLTKLSAGGNRLQCAAEHLAFNRAVLRAVLPARSYLDQAQDCKWRSSIQETDLDRCVESTEGRFKARSDVAVCGSLGRYLETKAFDKMDEPSFILQRREARCSTS